MKLLRHLHMDLKYSISLIYLKNCSELKVNDELQPYFLIFMFSNRRYLLNLEFLERNGLYMCWQSITSGVHDYLGDYYKLRQRFADCQTQLLTFFSLLSGFLLPFSVNLSSFLSLKCFFCAFLLDPDFSLTVQLPLYSLLFCYLSSIFSWSVIFLLILNSEDHPRFYKSE